MHTYATRSNSYVFCAVLLALAALVAGCGVTVNNTGFYYDDAGDGSGLAGDTTPTSDSGSATDSTADTLSGDTPSADSGGGYDSGAYDAYAEDVWATDASGYDIYPYDTGMYDTDPSDTSPGLDGGSADSGYWDSGYWDGWSGGEVDAWYTDTGWVDSSSDSWVYDVPPWSDSSDHSCCVSGGPGCADPMVASCVCASDKYCCGTAWDETCVQEVMSKGCGGCVGQDAWGSDGGSFDGSSFDGGSYDVGYDVPPDGAGTCQPICGAIGSKSEGWFDSCTMSPIYTSGGFPAWDQCKGCSAQCEGVGTSVEGWYSSCTGKPIVLEPCI